MDRLRHAAARPRLSGRDDWQAVAEQSQPRGRHSLAELLATIPDERRKAFVITQLLGLPYAEAAEAMGCPIGTVRSRVARARTSLIALVTDTDTPLDDETPAALNDRQRRSAAKPSPAMATVA